MGRGALFSLSPGDLNPKPGSVSHSLCDSFDYGSPEPLGQGGISCSPLTPPTIDFFIPTDETPGSRRIFFASIRPPLYIERKSFRSPRGFQGNRAPEAGHI